MVDFGAGNGLGGEGLRALGVGELVGVDLEPMARTAAERDRPGVYGDYLVGDLGAWSEDELDRLRAHRPTALVALSAVGVGHVPRADAGARAGAAGPRRRVRVRRRATAAAREHRPGGTGHRLSRTTCAR